MIDCLQICLDFAFKFNLRRCSKEAIAATELMDLAKDKVEDVAIAASYHLVLMDLDMPEMDGATAGAYTRSHFSST